MIESLIAPAASVLGMLIGGALVLLLRITRHPETRHWREFGWRKGFYVRVLSEKDSDDQ